MKKLGWVERRDRMEKVYPELLEASKEALDYIFHSVGGIEDAMPYEYNLLKQAISRAEGRE